MERILVAFSLIFCAAFGELQSTMQFTIFAKRSIGCGIQYICTRIQYNTTHCNPMRYIPLICRVRGPYGKLWTEFFPSFYGPSAKRVGHENKEGKNEDP